VGHGSSPICTTSRRCIACSARRPCSATRVDCSAILIERQPKMAINSRDVAPFMAEIVAPALRRPCAEQCGRSA
jgi:hypothetical protein